MKRGGQSLDDAVKLVDEQLLIPLPGRKRKVSEEAVQQEMAMFRNAQATMGR